MLFPIAQKVLSPYWDDTDLRVKGSVYVDLYNAENGSEILTTISTFINSDKGLYKPFKPTSAVVIEWNDICPVENSNCSLVRVKNVWLLNFHVKFLCDECNVIDVGKKITVLMLISFRLTHFKLFLHLVEIHRMLSSHTNVVLSIGYTLMPVLVTVLENTFISIICSQEQEMLTILHVKTTFTLLGAILY